MYAFAAIYPDPAIADTMNEMNSSMRKLSHIRNPLFRVS